MSGLDPGIINQIVGLREDNVKPSFRDFDIIFIAYQLVILPTLVLTACSMSDQEEFITPPLEWERAGWELVWGDEFNGDTINSENWTFNTGGSGWGNKEWQYYTDRPENARVEDGRLVIEARQEIYLGSKYTSARIITQYLHEWAYGRVEARMKLPTGQGVWSAFWMLGNDIDKIGWPNCGEIDIIENIGEPNTIYGTLHGPGYSAGDGVGTSHIISETALNQGFHVYAIEWEPGEIRWYLDDHLFQKLTDGDVPGDWVYDHPFFIIFNLAIGGNWPGYPDGSTEFPQQLIVDYVRVYRDSYLAVAKFQD
jgi:beta-glucanase (GH16 family)